jgi:HAD superfamily hydrolase (TIGR01456 family)
VPFTFLTNGGGKTEEEKATELGNMLGGLPIDKDLYIQSHTPYRELAAEYGAKPVIVIGQDPCKARDIMLGYGFTYVVTTGELHAAHPALWPFVPLSGSHKPCGKQPAAFRGPAAAAVSLDRRYAAAFVINDPAHWQLDLQVLVDLLVSDGGRLGTTSVAALAADRNASSVKTDDDAMPPHLFFSASDLEFSSAWPVPRFGQGSFLASLRGIWAAKTNSLATGGGGGGDNDFPHTIHGKPMASQYEFVERTEKQLQEARMGKHCVLERNYMIGDNPESDIRGAQTYNSSHGTKWLGVLVKTGVWDGKSTLSVKPDFIAKGVKEAVELIGREEGVDLTTVKKHTKYPHPPAMKAIE